MSNQSRRYGLFDFTDYIEKRVADFTGREWVFKKFKGKQHDRLRKSRHP
jgi:hypothetical protein